VRVPALVLMLFGYLGATLPTNNVRLRLLISAKAWCLSPDILSETSFSGTPPCRVLVFGSTPPAFASTLFRIAPRMVGSDAARWANTASLPWTRLGSLPGTYLRKCERGAIRLRTRGRLAKRQWFAT
jgi:hypothetical protein